jgi:hypothetical protein
MRPPINGHESGGFAGFGITKERKLSEAACRKKGVLLDAESGGVRIVTAVVAVLLCTVRT